MRIRSIATLTDFEELKKEIGTDPCTDDQMLSELIAWYRHTKLETIRERLGKN